MGMRVVLATANPDKVREISEIFESLEGYGGGSTGRGREVALLELVPRPEWVPGVEETGTTLEANACLKARALCEATGEAAVADDTGLEVVGLGGAPGVLSSRFAGPEASYEDNVRALLGALAEPSEGGGTRDRRARFRTVVALLWPDGRSILTEGSVSGRISTEPRGMEGFGYDCVFIPDEGTGQTFGEMGAAEKNAISHRGRAFRALAEMLASEGTGS